MNVRKANNKDLDSISAIFRETVRLINSKDYAEREIEVWSAVADNIEFWNKIIIEEDFFVVENEDKIIGFSSLRNDGYLHFMYVHHQYQNCGVASLLLNTIELKAAEMKLNEIFAYVSITALPFFQKRNFIKKDEITRSLEGVSFTNAVMYKTIAVKD